MPRHVRNFWIEVSADGVQPVATGPRSGDGGAHVKIKVREHGAVSTRWIDVTCEASQDGSLRVVGCLGDENGEPRLLFAETFER
jgi:hypothetical protein